MGLAGRLARAAIDSPLTPLGGLVALLLGVFAIIATPREEEPQIDVTMVDVFVPFPGAGVHEVESMVTIPAEQVLSQVAGIEHVHSVSKPGAAMVTVQFKVGVPRTEAIVRVRDTIGSHRDWISPELGVLEPVVKPRSIDDVPVLAVTLATDDPAKGAFELERVAHALEAELKRVPGTREVRTIGGPGRVVRVLLDADRLASSGISATDVREALSLNQVLPSGARVRGNRELHVETGDYLKSAADVRAIVVGSVDKRPVRVGDVAEVVDGAPQPTRYVWTADRRGESPAVTVELTKKPGANAVDVSAEALARLESLEGTVIPAGVRYLVTRDYGATAAEKASSLMKKLFFATASVVLLVLVALGRREAAIVCVAVVLTLAATLFASRAWGFTLNRVSLFALIFSIGILVDDAIVVVENIHRRKTRDGPGTDPGFAAAVDEVGGPTILATFTVIAALLPMAFITGLTGPYMSPIPINAGLGMLISLLVAFTLTPWLAARLLPETAKPETAKRETAKPGPGPGQAPVWPWSGTGPAPKAIGIERLLRRILEPFVSSPLARHNQALLGFAIAALIALSLGLIVARQVVLKMLPFDNKSEFQVVVDMPAGTPLEVTAAALHHIGARLATVPEVVNYQAYAGTASPVSFNGLMRNYALRTGPEQGDIQVNLVDKSHRTRKSHEIARAVRPALEDAGRSWGANVKVVEVPPGPPVLSPIVAEIYGPDDEGRARAAKQVRAALEATPGVVAVDDSLGATAPREIVRVDQARASILGVARRDAVETLRIGLAGSDVAPLHDAHAKYEVPVRLTLPAEQEGSLDGVMKLAMRAASGALVPLAEVVQRGEGEREHALHRKDLLPVVNVMADDASPFDSPLYGLFASRPRIFSGGRKDSRIDERWVSQPTDPYRGYTLKWDGEAQVTYDVFRDMGVSYAVGLVLIYLLVVAQFRSYVVPLIIMAPIPLTMIGVMPGHALLGAHFTATSMIGMIALAGIIVRNSILLVDFVNRRLAEGVALEEAILQSAAARAKPIALTAIAAMTGAAFILDDPIFNGLAVSLVFGIFVATLLTLVVIPVLYHRLLSR